MQSVLTTKQAESASAPGALSRRALIAGAGAVAALQSSASLESPELTLEDRYSFYFVGFMEVLAERYPSLGPLPTFNVVADSDDVVVCIMLGRPMVRGGVA
ncbi:MULTISPECIES: hypothetical protein [unclassified Neorhizobium]|uniref:hypothetical protein n=1 Tax=unclassified Neorhizobium TaxID=2629175 RepID=UPI001FF5362E|nr:MULTISPECIES: hypothetical protein [unclassified Neorhizobium]MCJ9672918.1 hypothetical protein [Neorhizobium sp. SHOUNA12B]MCJ9748541.1 hypothetical protein [Neorhizobium sp. SHOUNA12A]